MPTYTRYLQHDIFIINAAPVKGSTRWEAVSRSYLGDLGPEKPRMITPTSPSSTTRKPRDNRQYLAGLGRSICADMCGVRNVRELSFIVEG